MKFSHVSCEKIVLQYHAYYHESVFFHVHVASTVSASSATATPQSPPPTDEMLCLTQIV